MDKIPLKQVRGSLGLTQKQLAEYAHVSEKTIADIEKGKARPRATTVYLIVSTLNQLLREKGREEITVESLDWSPL